MREIDDDARQELFDIFPALAADLDSYGPAARASLKAAEARIAASLDPFAAAFA